MCGRAALGLTEAELIDLFRARSFINAQGYRPSYNIRPATATPIIRLDGGDNIVVNMPWGMRLPNTTKRIINARVETVAEKPMFRRLVAKNRCVMPVKGFYEWTSDKRPHLIKSKGAMTMNLACIYDDDAFVILTCEAAPSISRIHDRMPVILNQPQTEQWLDVDKFSFCECSEFLGAYKGEMELWQVAPLNRDDPSCMDPISSGAQPSIMQFMGRSPTEPLDRDEKGIVGKAALKQPDLGDPSPRKRPKTDSKSRSSGQYRPGSKSQQSIKLFFKPETQ